MARDVGDDGRLGGPPGLYDSVNLDRGGLVQRVRVPADPRPEQVFPWGSLSLNDSDNDDDALDTMDKDPSDVSRESLESGIPVRKSIAGNDF